MQPKVVAVKRETERTKGCTRHGLLGYGSPAPTPTQAVSRGSTARDVSVPMVSRNVPTLWGWPNERTRGWVSATVYPKGVSDIPVSVRKKRTPTP